MQNKEDTMGIHCICGVTYLAPRGPKATCKKCKHVWDLKGSESGMLHLGLQVRKKNKSN